MAIQLGADMVEIDVRRTRDGVLVAHHDATVRGQRVSDLTYSALRQTVGNTLATLEEITALTDGRVLLDIELKEQGYEEQALEILDRYISSDRFIITSFLEHCVAVVRRFRVRAGLLCESVEHPDLLFDRVERCHTDLVAPYVQLADDAFLQQAWDRGFCILVWTVNEPVAIARYADHPAVAGVITDVPDRALLLFDTFPTSP